ncbi:MAG: hypothetical protein KA191_11775 [Verrucomicrobia bacterium]|jgi:hypothetical protein|nr:hypothetical protein [Verrucomicrobiota bacterium]OQC63531.1 MAG: hypothetical protein BWX48_03169 [Verrucomicrobia bacterium ADurb.Bin006]HOA62694.1 hypothetical protein [Verrucomicrobiota bacterium]HQK01849.1 hypothetical protein [Verrucomicrobiota bacterium]
MRAAHKITARGYSAVARGYRLGGSERQADSNRHRTRLVARAFVRAACALRGWATCWQDEAAKLDATTATNLKELGYGG